MPAQTKYDLVQVTLSADSGFGSTFTANYPAGRTAKDYLGATDHQIQTQSYATLFATAGDFSVAFGASNMTVTVLTGVALTNGTIVYLNLDRAEKAQSEIPTLAQSAKMAFLQLVRILLGAPAAAVATAVAASQSLLAATVAGATINGTLVTTGVATFAHPRNVVAAWTGAAVLTVTGTDEYGKVFKESSASGTAFTGKKAFKTVTKVVVSADVTLLTVGNGVVLGLPAFLPDVSDVLREALDGAAATAGTLVAGDTTVATALTGDIRGTYSPNSAPNGARVFELTVALRDASYVGRAQFNA